LLWVDLFDEHGLLTSAAAIALQSFVALVALALLALALLGATGHEHVWFGQIAPQVKVKNAARGLRRDQRERHEGVRCRLDGANCLRRTACHLGGFGGCAGLHERAVAGASAARQARAVASAVIGEPRAYDEAPYFWSDQFGLRLQHVGHADHWHAVVLAGDEDSFTARYVDRSGTLVAALAANSAASVGEFRQELAA
jgi:hypothetical protein